jgi:serine protease Do
MIVRGSVMRPDLGFVPLTVTPSIVASFSLEIDRGVLTAHVETNKLGAAAGLQTGDVITAVDNVQIYNMGDFWHAYLRPGDPLPAQLTVFGKNGQVTLSLSRDAFAQSNR